jgi:hypothetical protein
MSLHNVISQTQAQTRSFTCVFSSEKGLEDFVFDGVWDAWAVVGYFYSYLLLAISC